jgi:transposase
VEDLEAEIARRMQPCADRVDALATIPGVEKIAAWHLVAELDPDVSVFPDADRCASWAGVSPGSCESAGRQLSGRAKKGNKYLRRILTQSAWAASRCKQGCLQAFFHRVKVRRGWARAVIAVGHKIVVIAYCILKTGVPHQDLGEITSTNCAPSARPDGWCGGWNAWARRFA